MADLADHAYGHALAVVGDPVSAVDAARRGLGRGGRSRVAVLGHTRAAALALSAAAPAAGELSSVMDVALALAASRPAVERVVVDLEVRHGLTRSGFARALGVAPAVAGSRATDVAAVWSAELDPALLAWLGPGDCEGLAALVDSLPGSSDVAGLLAAAPAVSAHAADCAPCADRLRAMVSVRSLVGQLPLPAAPAEVMTAARSARRRPAVPPPLSGGEGSGLWRRALVAAAAVLVAVGFAVAVAAVIGRDGSGSNERVDALTKLPPGQGALAVSTEAFDATTDAVVVTNRSGHRLRWESAATVPWLRTSPRSGVLEAGASTTVRLRIAETAPEGPIEATLSFTAPDGSTVSMAGSGTIERAPDVAAHREGCEVVASAEDEGRVAAVVLHWRTGPPGSAESTDGMDAEAAGGRYHGAIPPTATSWWVTAADARGNISHTPEEPVSAPAC